MLTIDVSQQQCYKNKNTYKNTIESLIYALFIILFIKQ